MWRFFKEKYLINANFPAYVIDGKIKKTNFEAQGIYVCDLTGLIGQWNFNKWKMANTLFAYQDR